MLEIQGLPGGIDLASPGKSHFAMMLIIRRLQFSVLPGDLLERPKRFADGLSGPGMASLSSCALTPKPLQGRSSMPGMGDCPQARCISSTSFCASRPPY